MAVSQVSLEGEFGILGDRLIVQTNDQRVLDAAQRSFGRFAIPPATDPVTLRLIVASGEGANSPPAASARGAGQSRHHTDAGHYLFSTPGGVGAADTKRGWSIVFVDDATADDAALLRYTFIEGPALAMLTRSRGYIAIHASGIARNGIGLALHGAEGAGKTTLAVAAARRGLDVFAEDGVFARNAGSGLEFWGLPWVQRLLPDAAHIFPELAGIEARVQPNLELKLEAELDLFYPGRTQPYARPAGVIVIERNAVPGEGGPSATTSVERLSATQALEALEVQWPWDYPWTQAHDEALAGIESLPMFRLQMAGTPDQAVDALQLVFDQLKPPSTPS